MKDRKTKPALKVVHRNDRAQIKRVLAGSGHPSALLNQRLASALAAYVSRQKDEAGVAATL